MHYNRETWIQHCIMCNNVCVSAEKNQTKVFTQHVGNYTLKIT